MFPSEIDNKNRNIVMMYQLLKKYLSTAKKKFKILLEYYIFRYDIMLFSCYCSVKAHDGHRTQLPGVLLPLRAKLCGIKDEPETGTGYT